MTRRADNTRTGSPPVFLRFPPDVLAAILKRSGPATRGKPSGPAEWIRGLVYRELELELPAAEERHRRGSVREGVEFTGAREKRRRAEPRQ